MDFPDLDFDRLNEMGVREQVTGPLLKHLGYVPGTAAHVHYELVLTDPSSQLGRKKPGRDPVIRGKADYVLEVDREINWTLEAKPASAPITDADVRQAYSYAAHPEIRGVLFAVCNGRELKVFQTNQSPGSPPVLEIRYEEMARSLLSVENLLSPDAIRKSFPRVELDTRRPLGPGLRSFAQIVGGYANFRMQGVPESLLRDLTFSIAEGSIERAQAGGLQAWLRLRSPFPFANELNKTLHLDERTLVTPDEELSDDASRPTRITGTLVGVIPRGTVFPVGDFELASDLRTETETEVTGVLSGQRFTGRFVQRMRMSGGGFPLPPEIVGEGDFELILT